MKKLFPLFATGLFFVSCATFRPVLNDNAQYRKVGEAQAETDIDMCMQRADSFLAKHKEERAQKQAGREAVGGAIVGGVFGLMTGRGAEAVAGGIAGGAAVGATSGYLGEKSKDNLKPDEMKQSYVMKCLNDKNYEVLGWK